MASPAGGDLTGRAVVASFGEHGICAFPRLASALVALLSSGARYLHLFNVAAQLSTTRSSRSLTNIETNRTARRQAKIYNIKYTLFIISFKIQQIIINYYPNYIYFGKINKTTYFKLNFISVCIVIDFLCSNFYINWIPHHKKTSR